MKHIQNVDVINVVKKRNEIAKRNPNVDMNVETIVKNIIKTIAKNAIKKITKMNWYQSYQM
jgi:hypothetical protein